jgi:integrase
VGLPQSRQHPRRQLLVILEPDRGQSDESGTASSCSMGLVALSGCGPKSGVAHARTRRRSLRGRQRRGEGRRALEDDEAIERPEVGNRLVLLRHRPALHWVQGKWPLLSWRFVRRLHLELDEVVTDADGTVRKVKRCVYTPHSLRATTAKLLLEAGEDIRKVQDLLGHRHVTTTQIYDKRRRSLKEAASHNVPI